MENNVNNNVASNTNPNVGSSGTSVNSNMVNNAGVTDNTVVVQTGATTVTPMINNTTATNVNPVIGNNGQINENNEQKSYKKFYIWMGVIVTFVLIISGVLLFFLLNGSIANRNRLICNITTQEDGYDYSIQRYYTFEDDKMVRVYYTHNYEYNNELTDDMYNQTFNEIINIDNNVGSTKYGLATTIEKNENTVKITSYEPNYFGEVYKDIKNNNEKQGYSCE